MAINKFQRSRLIFDLSVKPLLLESHQYVKTVFSETIGSIELKFYMETPYNKLTKIYTNCFGHLTKMADMPIYGKNPLKIFFLNLLPIAFKCEIF